MAMLGDLVWSCWWGIYTCNLLQVWSTQGRISKDDWMEWLRRLSVELLKESPSPSLRSCWALAQAYSPLATELFNAAFVSCWMDLRPMHQEELLSHLKTVLKFQNIPEIAQTILNLAEFMEHCEEAVVRVCMCAFVHVCMCACVLVSLCACDVVHVVVAVWSEDRYLCLSHQECFRVL